MTHRKRSDPSEEGPPHCPGRTDNNVAGLLPRHKGIYHAGCTGYPNPTYP